MSPIVRAFLVTALGFASACAGVDRATTKSAENSRASSARSVDRGASNVPHDEVMVGALSEEEFLALHQPPTSGAPPRRGQMIEIAGSRAYLSLPVGLEAPMPGIVVIHEWWGLNESTMYWADRLAAEGMAAVAVDLYGGVVARTVEEASRAMGSVDRKRSMEILLAAHRFLKEDPRIQAPRRACIGWSFGGGETLRLALAARDLDAAVVYYGNPITNPVELAPMNAKLLAIFGSHDKRIPPEQIAAFERGLTASGKDFKIRIYPAEHFFANPSSAFYDEARAAEAWREVRAFLKENLATQP
jgi:carboxymethylenebutenolidase